MGEGRTGLPPFSSFPPLLFFSDLPPLSSLHLREGKGRNEEKKLKGGIVSLTLPSLLIFLYKGAGVLPPLPLLLQNKGRRTSPPFLSPSQAEKGGKVFFFLFY